MLQVGLASFQRVTRKTALSHIPSWLITSFDIDVEDSKDGILGEGGCGIVKKAVWRRITVAVKFMHRGTDPQVLNPLAEVGGGSSFIDIAFPSGDENLEEATT